MRRRAAGPFPLEPSPGKRAGGLGGPGSPGERNGGPAERPGRDPGPIGGDSLPGRRPDSAGPLCWPPLTLPKKGRRCLPLRIVCPWNVYFFSVLFVRWLPLAASDCRSGSEFYHLKKKDRKKKKRNDPGLGSFAFF